MSKIISSSVASCLSEMYKRTSCTDKAIYGTHDESTHHEWAAKWETRMTRNDSVEATDVGITWRAVAVSSEVWQIRLAH